MKTQITAILTAVLLATPSVWAWDSDGHMQVAEIAWQHLTAASRTRASTLLKLNPNYQSWIAKVPAAKREQVAFVMAATWPDYIKKSVAGYTNDSDTPPPVPASSQNIGYPDHLMHRYWHFIDTPFSTDSTALVQPVAPNAKTQIELFTAAIASGASDDIKSYDLVWLEHLVGDVHQPLHATSRFSADLPMGDHGGNLVVLCANSCKTKSELHAFWDDVLGVSYSPTTAIIAADKLPAAPAAGAAVANDQAWITESFDAAKQFVYASPVGPGSGPYTLSATYKSKAKTEAKARIELAGIRLANLINTNLK